MERLELDKTESPVLTLDLMKHIFEGGIYRADIKI